MIVICGTPVWLQTTFAVLVQEGGVLMHGKARIGAKDGKGGSGHGAGVGSCRSMDPVRIQSGTNFACSVVGLLMLSGNGLMLILVTR